MYSVNWLTKVVTIPQSDLIHDSGTLYRLDMVDFHSEIRRLEYEFDDGLWAEQILSHIEGITISGATFAPFDIIINGYSIEFENGLYTVVVEGSNNNIADVGDGILVQNTVQVIPSNSAGLITSSGATGTLDPSVIAALVHASLIDAINAERVIMLGKDNGVMIEG